MTRVTIKKAKQSIGFIGMLGVSFLMSWGAWASQTRILDASRWIFKNVGPTSLGLAPLTAVGIGVAIHWWVDRNPRADLVVLILKIITEVAPLLGLLGTMLGIYKLQAYSYSDVKDVHALVKGATRVISVLPNCLLSSVWGAALAIPAIVMKQLVLYKKARNPAFRTSDLVASAPGKFKKIASGGAQSDE